MGHRAMKRLSELPKSEREPENFQFDGVLTFSKEHLVGFSGAAHEADQPHHLKVLDTNICATECLEEFGNPCEKFCPAAVYEMVAQVIKKAKKNKRKIGICGDAPSSFPEFARFLVKQGIDSISLSPDAVIKTILHISKAEKK